MAAGYPPEDKLDEADLAAAKWAWQNNRPAGRGADTLPGAKRLFLPMRTGRGPIGVVGIDSDKTGPAAHPGRAAAARRADRPGALAIERVHLVEDMDRVKRTVETERLRSALLTSISHDLKTPLAAVLGAAGTLRDLAGKLSERRKGRPARHDHGRGRAAQPLHRQPARHDPARIGRHRAQRLPCTTSREIVGSALRRADKILAGHQGRRSISPAICRCSTLDPVLFEQALFNVLDNAAKYSPAGSTIRIEAWRGRRLGFAAGDRRGRRASRRPSSSASSTSSIACRRATRCGPAPGSGLPIARGFVEAMQRHHRRRPIAAIGAGAVFTIRLPVPAETKQLDTAA